jgi:hypothetical protein
VTLDDIGDVRRVDTASAFCSIFLRRQERPGQQVRPGRRMS